MKSPHETMMEYLRRVVRELGSEPEEVLDQLATVEEILAHHAKVTADEMAEERRFEALIHAPRPTA